MKLYHYDQDGVFAGETEARMSPLEPDVPLVPANATLVAPPFMQAGQVAVWAGETWETLSDNRGTEYWMPDGTKHTIETVGTEISAEAVIAPPDESGRWVWDGATWVLSAEATRQQALEKLKELDLRSIRHLREHLASLVPALDDIEQEAVTERAKLPQKDRG